MKQKSSSASGGFTSRGILGLLFCAIGVCLAIVGVAAAPSNEFPEQYLRRDAPPDTTPYARPVVPEDFKPMGKEALAPTPLLPTPQIFVVDTIVNNTNPALQITDSFGDSEPSIAINPTNPLQIAILAFSGSWGANTPVFYSTDAGNTWTKEFTIPIPPGAGNGATGCPCDQDPDYERGNLLAGTFLSFSPTDPYTGITSDPTNSASWNWTLSGGNAVKTNAFGAGNTDQPWMLTNRDTVNAATDNIFTAYDDFSVSPIGMRVAVSLNSNPPNFTRDNQAGTSGGPAIINPGHRLAVDHRNGWVYDLYQNSTAVNNSRAVVNYTLNRSTDGGQTWTLNASSTGIQIDSAGSTQGIGPQTTFVGGNCGGAQPNNLFKFGTVNALLGGVDHAAVDPNNGDVYVVYGDRDGGTGNNRLSIRRLTDNGSGGLNIGAKHFVTGQVQAALPSVAVAANGVVGVLYMEYDGVSGGFPSFSAHLATSSNHGTSWSDATLENFLSPSTDNGNCRQRVLGDYEQIKAVGNIFYGVFTGNGVPFGRTTSNLDPIFFKASATPPPTLSTQVSSATITIGGSFNDSATLSGGFNPTGTLTFNLYGAGDTTCSSAPIFTQTVVVAGDGTYPSASFTPATPGTYNYIASYSGDINNFPVSGSCGDPNESVVVQKATPTLKTAASGPVHVGRAISDTATVTGGFHPTGMVNFNLFGPGNPTCSGSPIATYVGTLNNNKVTAGAFTTNATGTYHYIAQYEGDANNNVVTGVCGAPGESSVVSP